MPRILLVLLIVLCVPAMVDAQSDAGAEKPEPPPQDTCFLDLLLPRGATVEINGRDYGQKRQLVFRSLNPGQRYVSKLRVHFPGGAEAKRTVFIEGGRRVRLALLGPDAGRPELVLQTGHAQAVADVAFSPDGRFIASGAGGTQVLLWERATGRQLRTLHGVTTWVNTSLRFSVDGRHLVACAGDFDSKGTYSELVMWDVQTGRLVRAIRDIRVDLSDAALTDDGAIAAVGVHRQYDRSSDRESSQRALLAWDAATGKKLPSSRMIPTKAGAYAAAISPDGRFAAFGGDAAAVIELATGKATTIGKHIGHSPCFSSDGATVLFGWGKQVRLWDHASGSHRLVGGHDGHVMLVRCSPDGQTVATVGSDYQRKGSIFLWDLASGRLLRVVRPHQTEVTSIHFSPDGKRAVSVADDDNNAVVWDVTTGKRLLEFQDESSSDPEERDPFRSASFSPDGRTILTRTHEAVLWDAASGKRLRKLANLYHCAEFTPDGKYVLTDDILRDASTGEEVRTFDTGEGSLVAASFSADGRRLAAMVQGENEQGDWVKSAYVYDVETGKLLHKVEGDDDDGEANVAQISADGKLLLVHSDYDQYRTELWEIDSRQRRFSVSEEDPERAIRTARFSADGRLLLTGSRGGLTVRDLTSGQPTKTLSGNRYNIGAKAVSPSGKWVVAADGGVYSEQPRLMLWDVESGGLVHDFGQYAEQINALAFSPDGREILTGGADGTPILWDAETGKMVRRFQGRIQDFSVVHVAADGKLTLESKSERVTWDVATGPNRTKLARRYDSISPDHRIAFTRQKDGSVLVWDTSTGEDVVRISPDDDARWPESAFSPDHRSLVTFEGGFLGADANEITVWDLSSGRARHKFETVGMVSEIAFTPDSKHFLMASIPRMLRVYNVASGRAVADLKGHDYWIVEIAFSPDGRLMATGGLDKKAILWDTQNWRRLQVLTGHEATVRSCSFSDNGKYLATGADSGEIKIWDTVNGRLLRTLEGHQLWVTSLKFRADGQTLVSSSRDGTVRFWDVATGQQRLSLMLPGEGNDWLAVTPEGLFDGSKGGREKVSFRVGDGLKIVPVDRFFQDFYYPGLLASVWNGERPLPEIELSEDAPPRLRLLSPARGASDSRDVTIQVEAVDAGKGISRWALYQNGARVLAPGESRPKGKATVRTFRVSLVEGENRFRITATNADGSWEAEPVQLTLSYHRPLSKPQLYVVAVGINRYAQETMNLKFAVSDAKAVAGLFRKRGAALYAKVNVTELTDDQATRAGIQKALQTVAAKAQPQDTLLVFFAGHGTMVQQRYYFVPHEFKTKANSLEADIRKQALPVDELGDWLAAVPSLKRMLIFDTCQSGGVLGLSKGARNPFALRGAIERLSRAQGVFTIAAAASTADAQEIPQLKHGALTYALLAGLGAIDEGPLAETRIRTNDPDEVVDVLQWFSFASGQVPRLTAELLGSAQDVQTSGEGTSFPVLPIVQ